MCMTRYAFAGVKVCSTRERNLHVSVCRIRWGEVQRPIRWMELSLQSRFCSYVDTGTGLKLPPGLNYVFYSKLEADALSMAKNVFLPREWPVFGVLVTLLSGIESWLEKEECSESRGDQVQGNCVPLQDHSGSREALPGLGRARGALRVYGPLQAHPGPRSHLRELQALWDSGGLSLGPPLPRDPHLIPSHSAPSLPALCPHLAIRPQAIQIHSCKKKTSNFNETLNVPSLHSCVASSLTSFRSLLKCHLLNNHP